MVTGPDDAAFCHRVSEAIALGYRSYEGPAVTFNGEQVIVAQALLWPAWELYIGQHTVPAAVAVALILGLVFILLTVYPYLEKRFAGDTAHHNLLQRPRDVPVRTGIGAIPSACQFGRSPGHQAFACRGRDAGAALRFAQSRGWRTELLVHAERVVPLHLLRGRARNVGCAIGREPHGPAISHRVRQQ